MTYNIVENDFQRSRTAAYKLSILVGMDSLVYSVYEGVSNKLLALKTIHLPASEQMEDAFTSALGTAIEKEDLLSVPFGQTNVTFSKGTTVLVPQRLFNEDEKETYLSSTSLNPEFPLVHTDQLKPLKITAVYQPNEVLEKVLSQHFPKAKFYNAATPFLLGSHRVNQSVEQESAAYLCMQKDTFQLALFHKDELLFYNSFEYKAASDVLYFTLLSYEQYEFSTDTATLFLSGQIIDDSDIYKMLYRYINKIGFLSAPSFIHTGKASSNVNHSFFFPLHSLVLC